MSATFLLVLGVVVHIVLLVAIFDLYFVSPIIHGINPIINKIPSPCDRVVFISIDGLRMDALLEQDQYGKNIAQFLNKKMLDWGAWGVSKCHLPTESRPGHVAMLAGFYEDPSAVTKGWKENPVDFDSLFNKSACSFSWGSPDIVNIFYKGLNHDCAFKWTYSMEQNFAGNTMAYDNWVLDSVGDFFAMANSSKLYSKSKSLFFLHLLGQDTSGHTHKPWTEPYRTNLKNVDHIILQVEKLFTRVFPENKTAFVVSADHGMTDWGSHGAGDPSETLTPIISWGCGIKRQSQNEEKIEIDQADITPLLAILLGIPIPVHSVGKLPCKLLNFSRLQLAEANFLNAQQIAQHYLSKRAEIEQKTSMYTQFKALDSSLLFALKQSIFNYIKQGDYDEANDQSRTLFELSLEGIQYYQNYFQSALLIATASISITWVLILFLGIIDVQFGDVLNASFIVSSISVGIIVSFVIYIHVLPITYHVYGVLAALLLRIVTFYWKALWPSLTAAYTAKTGSAIIMIIAGIELLVFGFFERWSLSIILSCIVIWPFLQKNCKGNACLLCLWTISGLLLALFSLLPVIGKVPNPVLALSASVIIAVTLFATSWDRNLFAMGKALLSARCFLVLSAGVNNYFVHSTFFENNLLNATNSLISWLLLALSFAFLFEPSESMLEKLQNSYGILSVPFILLSINHEVFFLVAFLIHILCWIRLEMLFEDVLQSSVFYHQYTRKKLHDGMTFQDFRRAFFFLTYIYIGFFGIGNLATLNSFDPAWVRCFLTTFSPFTMTALILLKVVIPFFVVSLALRALSLILKIRPYKIFLAVLVYCNLMGINFLFLVRNEGSWLDIGTSLSHYVIQQATIVFLLLLHSLSHCVIIPLSASYASSNKFHLL